MLPGLTAEVQPKLETSKGKSNDHAPKCLKLTGPTLNGAGQPLRWASVASAGHPDYFSFDGTSSIAIDADGTYLVICQMNCSVPSYAVNVSIRSSGTDVVTCHAPPTNQLSSIVVTDVLGLKKGTRLDAAVAMSTYHSSYFNISAGSQFSVAYLGAL
eukprot:TRINITY_DN3187_c0_g1_i2.p2 TRINITY_DN3187_c0_g1~~TRINITY_DN3187_c0_g1_i2.p2  ORF type:complete len:157 (+),score=20.85 TRINITY_DN3187_c0_g1_i2:2855-3325(+)